MTTTFRTWVACLAGMTGASLMGVACSDQPTVPEDGPLAGLTQVVTNDSASTPSQSDGPGFFRGTVMGYEEGPDTLATAVRLVDVQVTAYPRVRSTADTLGVGPVAGTAETDENGEFVLPELAGGEYIVTFNPPAGSRYEGGWTVGLAHSESGDHPWWIMLRAR